MVPSAGHRSGGRSDPRWSIGGQPLAWRKVSTPAEARFQPGTVDVLDLGNLSWNEVTPGVICPTAGKAAAEYVLKAGELALAGEVEAVVTASLTATMPTSYWPPTHSGK